MKKTDLLAAVESKPGYVATILDNKTPDSPAGAKEKRFLLVETLNQDGTKGMTNVTYVHDTENDVAWFYNVEPLSFEKEYKTDMQVAQEAIIDYCDDTFHAYRVEEINTVQKFAIVTTWTLASGSFTETRVIVYKNGASPITHAPIA